MSSAKSNAILAGFAAVLIWGIAPSAIHSTQLPTSFFLVLRFALFAPILAACLPGIFRRARQLGWLPWLMMAPVIGLNFGLQTLALRSVSASAYVIAFTLTPVLSLLSMNLRPSRRIWSWAALAAAGTVPVLVKSAGEGSAIGLAALIGGMLSWVALSYLMKQYFQAVYTDSQLTAVINGLALTLLGTLWMLQGFPAKQMYPLDWVAVAFAGIAMPAATYTYSRTLRELPMFSAFVPLLEPVVGVFAAYCLLGERLSALETAGALMTLGAIGMLTWELAAMPGPSDSQHAAAL